MNVVICTSDEFVSERPGDTGITSHITLLAAMLYYSPSTIKAQHR